MGAVLWKAQEKVEVVRQRIEEAALRKLQQVVRNSQVSVEVVRQLFVEAAG